MNADSYAKYQDLVQGATSPCPSPDRKQLHIKFPNEIEKPVNRKRTSSTIAKDNPRMSTRSTSFPNIEVLSLHQAPSVDSMIPLHSIANDSSNGYHHWTAKSGTLIANMLVAAG